MMELILEAQKALDKDDMKAYECVQAKIREKYLNEEAENIKFRTGCPSMPFGRKLNNFKIYHECCNKLKNKKV